MRQALEKNAVVARPDHDACGQRKHPHVSHLAVAVVAAKNVDPLASVHNLVSVSAQSHSHALAGELVVDENGNNGPGVGLGVEPRHLRTHGSVLEPTAVEQKVSLSLTEAAVMVSSGRVGLLGVLVDYLGPGVVGGVESPHVVEGLAGEGVVAAVDVKVRASVDGHVALSRGGSQLGLAVSHLSEQVGSGVEQVGVVETLGIVSSSKVKDVNAGIPLGDAGNERDVLGGSGVELSGGGGHHRRGVVGGGGGFGASGTLGLVERLSSICGSGNGSCHGGTHASINRLERV